MVWLVKLDNFSSAVQELPSLNCMRYYAESSEIPSSIIIIIIIIFGNYRVKPHT